MLTESVYVWLLAQGRRPSMVENESVGDWGSLVVEAMDFEAPLVSSLQSVLTRVLLFGMVMEGNQVETRLTDADLKAEVF